MIDAREVERRTGWPVVAIEAVESTNDEASARAPRHPDGRVVVVATRQTAGRGRGGAGFSSPAGGLYVSIASRVRVEDVPAPLVAATAVAVAWALERVAPVDARLKWPNDVWIGERKVAGILVEATMGGRGADDRATERRGAPIHAVVGIGVNVTGVPADLPADVRAATTALDDNAPAPVRLEDLLTEVLVAFDEWTNALGEPDGRARVEAEYRRRAALLGRRVAYRLGDAEETGVLRDLSLERGLAVETPGGAVVWRPMALVRLLRPCGSAETPPVIPS